MERNYYSKKQILDALRVELTELGFDHSKMTDEEIELMLEQADICILNVKDN